MTRRTIVAAGLVFISFVCTVPSHAQDANARFRADVEKMLEVTGALAVGTQMATFVTDQMIDGLKKQRPGLPDRAFDLIKEVLGAEFAKMFDAPDGLRSKLVDIHMKHLTHEEVLGLLEFYNTPIGRKAIAVMPVMAQEGAAAGQEWAVENMPRIAGVVEQRLRAEGFIK